MICRVRRVSFALLLSFFLLHLGQTPAYALDQPFDHSLFDEFLKKVVNENGEVNYAAVKENRQLLDQYIQQFLPVKMATINAWPREEGLAIFLNLFHASVIRQIADHYPVKSVQKIPGFWETTVITFRGIGYSLNSLRSDILMGRFRDEKIHLVLACGAKGCPKFRQEAFTGPKVEGQLYVWAREFINDPNFTFIDPKDKKIRLSKLFKWYADDFVLDFGSPEEIVPGIRSEEAAILSFIAYYTDDPDKLEFLETKKYKVKYFPFNWALNESRS